jgi:hypothetical protein
MNSVTTLEVSDVHFVVRPLVELAVVAPEADNES